MAGQHAREHEQEVREPVQVAGGFGADVLGPRRQRPHPALGASHHRTRHVAGGRGGPAAGEDEILQRRQRFVEGVQGHLQAIHMLGLDQLHARDAQLAAQVEQVVLYFREAAGHGFRQAGHRQHHADRAVGLIDGTVGLDAGVVLAHPGAVTQASRAEVAGAGVDLAEPVTHGAASVREGG